MAGFTTGLGLSRLHLEMVEAEGARDRAAEALAQVGLTDRRWRTLASAYADAVAACKKARQRYENRAAMAAAESERQPGYERLR